MNIKYNKHLLINPIHQEKKKRRRIILDSDDSQRPMNGSLTFYNPRDKISFCTCSRINIDFFKFHGYITLNYIITDIAYYLIYCVDFPLGQL